LGSVNIEDRGKKKRGKTSHSDDEAEKSPNKKIQLVHDKKKKWTV